MSITSDLIRGHTEGIILSHLRRGDSYGYEINKSIHEKTGGLYELKEATLYSAFRRMEGAGLIRSYWGNKETGARRRYYSITTLGTQVLEQHLADWAEAKELIDRLLTPMTL
ncbi:PadR family transcriptional regulator [Ethanoligenens sp.]|uniref:PadR family transcriptional regulator n=1 Tax=Ethanoligenens sp. TaxID=2099655 RepID=UPI0039E7DDBD